ncbi:MAG: MotA/TolQ/ExbB proton channel family protein [Bdellovibrionota bacterium]|nr:MotA/TolQ/ExbB proton channel family protein [Bdellovibrionota bacterium]
MNFLVILAFFIASGVVGYVILTSTDDPGNFIDVHGLMVVLGGTFACAAIAYQLDRIFTLMKVFLIRMVKGKKPNYKNTIIELVEINKALNNGADPASEIEKCKDFFMKDNMKLAFDNLLEPRDLQMVLYKRVKTRYDRYLEDAKMFEGLGKYPPAMGLMGAVIGMIALLGGLGKPGAEATVGPAMSVALIATFYGIAFANLIIIPIGDNLIESAKQEKVKNTIIVEGILLLKERSNPMILVEKLNSYLLPSEQLNWKDYIA